MRASQGLSPSCRGQDLHVYYYFTCYKYNNYYYLQISLCMYTCPRAVSQPAYTKKSLRWTAPSRCMGASGSSASGCLGEPDSVNVRFDEQGGRIIEVHVKQDATVLTLKKAVEDQEGISTEGMSIRTTSNKVGSMLLVLGVHTHTHTHSLRMLARVCSTSTTRQD